MQGGLSHERNVCLSVRLSVCLLNAWIVTYGAASDVNVCTTACVSLYVCFYNRNVHNKLTEEGDNGSKCKMQVEIFSNGEWHEHFRHGIARYDVADPADTKSTTYDNLSAISHQ